MEKFHQEISSLNSIFKSNDYPENFIDSCIKHFLDKLFVKNQMSLSAPKLQLLCVFHCTGKSSLILEHIWDALLRKINHSESLMLFFDQLPDFSTYFRFKYFLEKIFWKILSGVVYHYTCSNCKVTYYGKTLRHFFY